MASSLQRLSLGRGNDVRREILFYSLALAAFHLLHHKGFSMRNLNGRMSRLISKRNERNNKKAILHNQKSTDKREPFFFRREMHVFCNFFYYFFWKLMKVFFNSTSLFHRIFPSWTFSCFHSSSLYYINKYTEICS